MTKSIVITQKGNDKKYHSVFVNQQKEVAITILDGVIKTNRTR